MEKYYSVVTTQGEYVVIASSIQIKDGTVYFNNPNGATKKTVPAEDVITIKPKQRVYSKVSKACGKVVGVYTTYWTKQTFTKMARDMCPSTNPLVKGIWNATAWAGSIGVGCITSQLASDAVEETIQPVCDFATGLYSVVKNLKDEKKKSEMKEVFEENN